jgi:hypothetical protein
MPPPGLDLLQPQRPVAARAGQNDADRFLAMALGERAHELVDRMVNAPHLGARAELKVPLVDDHVFAGGIT